MLRATMLVVHPHLHRRRTGISSHVESVTRGAPSTFVYENALFGRALDPALPHIGLREVLARAKEEELVWHAHRNVEMMLGLLLRLLHSRLRLVFTRHSATPPSGLTRWLLGKADRVVALTEEMARTLPMPSTVIGHGIDLQRFSPPSDRDESWKALGLGGRFGIGVVGRVRREKGQGDFTEAILPHLPGSDWKPVLVGAVRPNDEIWAFTLQEKLRGELQIVGQQKEIERWYRGLTILVQPSYSEGYGLSLLEGLASGCCVVATRISDFPTLIEDGKTGFLYEPGDAKTLGEILGRLMREPEHARAIGAAAAESARAFGIDREQRKLEALYRAMVQG